jgi:hypothetical protein
MGNPRPSRPLTAHSSIVEATDATCFGPFFAGFIGDSSPAARVEGARRSPCKFESRTTAAGFVLRTV